MASHNRGNPITTVFLHIFAFITEIMAIADQRRTICGSIAPLTVFTPNKTCETTGFSTVYTGRINWSDGSYSDTNLNITTQLAIGSCCSTTTISYYATGMVTSGRYSGESVIEVYTFHDHNQSNNGCESSAGLSRISGETMLLIGRKGVGNWIECTGNSAIQYSPALNSTPSTGHLTFSVAFDKCSHSVESC